MDNHIRSPKRHRDQKTICFTQEGILEHLHQNPNLINDKKFHELIIGWILTQFLEPPLRKTAQIWFPPKAGWESHLENSQLTIDWLLDNHDKIFDDSEVDICIGTPKLHCRFQITRFVYQIGESAKRRLADLILQKCRMYVPDQKLCLVISVESKPNINEQELINLLKEVKVSVPFGSIIVITKASTKRGHFSYCQLYPRLIIGKNIKVPLPV